MSTRDVRGGGEWLRNPNSSVTSLAFNILIYAIEKRLAQRSLLRAFSMLALILAFLLSVRVTFEECPSMDRSIAIAKRLRRIVL